MLKLAIAVPTYNEVNNVEALIESISRVSSQHPDTSITLFVLDDSSPDGTASFVEQVAPALERDNFTVRVIVKPTKEGLGAAYIHGFELILSEEFDHILQMDADLSHDPKYISGLHPPGACRHAVRRRLPIHPRRRHARLVVSSQVPQPRRQHLRPDGAQPADQRLHGRIQHVLEPRCCAASSRRPYATGYGFILVLKYRALLAAKRVVELPIVFFDRTNGESKIPRNTAHPELPPGSAHPGVSRKCLSRRPPRSQDQLLPRRSARLVEARGRRGPRRPHRLAAGLIILARWIGTDWEINLLYTGDSLVLPLLRESILAGQPFEWVFSSQLFLFPEARSTGS